MAAEELIQITKEAFVKHFGSEGDIRMYFAPGRVNLIGEHTDYNGGHVFPCALTMGTYAAARKRTDRKIRMYSANLDRVGVKHLSLDDLVCRKQNGWSNYPLGVVWAFAERGMKCDVGFDLVIYGDIPAGSGLSSSASLEVLTGTVLKDLYGFDVDGVEIALIGQRSENEFNGLSCGIMDQFASSMGKKDHAIFLDTATLKYEYAPVDLTDAKVVITNSKVKHSLVSSAYNDRRRESETALKDLQKTGEIPSLGALTEEEFEARKSAITDPVCCRRAKHAVYENQRTVHAVEALKKGDLETFGKLINASHDSLRDDYEVSCEEVDVLVDLARSVPGVLGSRITGGGFGGCTVSIVRTEAIEAFRKTVLEGYREKTGLEAEIYVAEIGDGAHRIEAEA